MGVTHLVVALDAIDLCNFMYRSWIKHQNH